ncbi:MAG: imidazole glycerol phosphate synthase subunit HisH [Polaromonas sp.]|uniref:imidazole glycerol phosphate synthase subunit HisH n=1 Tax=Polaromonas sp. TaxID=1869339 RepID=UPI0027229742|nr:imidazole glycerol phosphate synthase subunit HisH [Polaromonas sp.]MDO9112935.1 imidazole glycerol phosphate synthase subunit HisH [Polaromonas sp.]MDP1885134.1 imidazole glycerol phosphate synthase subunit HisH [Polaromonas sp.]
MSAPEVTVIDYGVGNLLSVQRGLEHCGAKVTLTADPERILSAKRVVLPGVGAFENAMMALGALNLVGVIKEVGRRETPLLGICLGMQLLLDESDEFGITAGLGLIPGRVIAIPVQSTSGDAQKVPHIGWNALLPSSTRLDWNGTLLQDNRPGDASYFVHSFMAVPTDPMHRIADCVYGGHRIPAAIGRDQITGCQFHPEKSGEVGLKILRRFCVS